MKAITIAEPKRLELIDIPEPNPPGPGEALIKTYRMGVCGTDISSYLGKFPFFDYPRIPGHELGVEVLAVGADVSSIKPGDRCSVEPYMNCGRCYACRKGYTNCCENLEVIGVMCDGGLCDQLVVPASKLHVSNSLTYDQLALVETLAIGCHGMSRAKPTADDHVLIIGAGPIGMSMLEFTRLTGAEITLMDITPEKLNFCKQNYSIENTVLFRGDGSEMDELLSITKGDRFAIVCDATGNHQSMTNALRLVAHTGTLLFLGVTSETLAFAHPDLHKPEVTIKSSRNALPNDFKQIIELIEQGKINTDTWITHRIGFEQCSAKFNQLTLPATGVIKAMIEVNEP